MIPFLKHKRFTLNIFVAICAFTCLHRVVVQAIKKQRLTISVGVSQAICTSTAKYTTSKTIQGPHKDPSKYPSSPKPGCEKLQWNKCGSRKRCFTFACLSSASSSPGRETRIVGGVDALPHEFPHQVYFKAVNASRVWCGGSILNEKYVVTAAHCFYKEDPSLFTVVAGGHSLSNRSEKEQERKLKKIIIHENYEENESLNDIALIEVDPPFHVTDAAAPVLLPMQNYNATGDAIVIGWGELDDPEDIPDILQKVTLPIITDAECHEAYKFFSILTPSNICAGYLEVGEKSSCVGDSGGPLMIKLSNGSYLVVGIVSWSQGCAIPGYPGVYAEVAWYVDWIYNNSGGINPGPVPQVTPETTDPECQD